MLFVSRGPKNPRTSRRVPRTFLGGILAGSDAALRRDHYAKINPLPYRCIVEVQAEVYVTTNRHGCRYCPVVGSFR